MSSTSGQSDLKVYWNEKNSTPTFISVKQKKGGLSKQGAPLAAKAMAIEFFKENTSIFQLENPEEELQATDEISDALGKTHIKFNQIYNGIPVWGHDVVSHLDEHNQVYAINARYAPTPTSVAVNKLNISSQSAVQIARMDLEKTMKIENLPDWAKSICNYHEPQTKKYVWIEDKTQQPHLVWHVQIRPNIRDNWYYFVDAQYGAILEKYNATNFDGPGTAQATDLNGITQTLHSYQVGNTYYMIDASRPIWQTNQPDILNDPRGALLTIDLLNHDLDQNVKLYHVTSENNSWTDPVSVSAHSNMGIVFNYFYNIHGRRAIDNQGSTIMSLIHVTEADKPMDNAYWNGALMLYGDGNVLYKPLAGGLDAAAHEMAHGITQHTVGLEYKFQSGALNESISDVFGVMVDRDDWMIGEDVVKTNYYPSGAMRDMKNPHNGGTNINDFSWQPENMNEYVELDIKDDNGGVHTNSGIPNHACYLIGDAIGKDKTEKIYYRILDARYLNTQSNFVNMRLAAIQAAKDLYGDGSAELNAVIAAFDAVGISSSGGSQPDPDVPPVIGEQWIATIDWSTEALYLVKPVIQNSDTDIKLLTTTQVSTETGNPISVTDDGSLIMFVDNNHYIRIINSDGSDEQVISSDAVWNSIALSPDGMKLAATTTLQDSSIYIFDFSGSNNNKKIRLYSPTTQEGVRNYTTVYADAMDWNLTSEYLIFDSFTSIPQASGDNLEYWNINMLDPANEIIIMLFPPQPEGVSIGNPSFGQTNDIYFVFDYLDINQGIYQVRSANLFTGDVFLIEDNENSVGYPRYSPDDRKLVFQRWQSDGTNQFPTLRQIELKESKTEPAGSSIDFVNEGMLPAWFAIGSRPTNVEQPNEVTPTEFYLTQNYPNPFNHETVIEYQLPLKGKVTVTVYNILGNEVAVLAQGEQEAGTHRIVFNGSDLPSGIYLYRLKTTNIMETRRMILLK
jgi:bacillolysin